MQTKNLQMSKLALEKVEEPEVKFPTFTGSQRKLGNFRKVAVTGAFTTSDSDPSPAHLPPENFTEP